MDDTQIIDLYWTGSGSHYGYRREVPAAFSMLCLEYPPQPSRCGRVALTIPISGPGTPCRLSDQVHFGPGWGGSPEPVTGPLEGRADPKPGRGYGDAAGGTGRSASPTIGDRSRRRRSGFGGMCQHVICGDRRRITGISSCGAMERRGYRRPSQSVWIAARAG